MKEKLLKLRVQFLQFIADFIYFNLEHAMTEQQFNQWMWQGLWLDAWCVERGIYLN